MSEQLDRRKAGLSQSQFDLLARHVRTGSGMDIRELVAQSAEHSAKAESAHARNRFVNVRLANAIHETITQLHRRWTALPQNARPWLKAAILYFAGSHDDEPDFASPIGFEDDVEVLNACLRFAKLDDLCLNPEDYDHGAFQAPLPIQPGCLSTAFPAPAGVLGSFWGNFSSQLLPGTPRFEHRGLAALGQRNDLPFLDGSALPRAPRLADYHGCAVRTSQREAPQLS